MTKVISASTRPSAGVDKENHASNDQPSRPSTTAAPLLTDHSLINGTGLTNGLPNPLMASASIDASSNATHAALKTSASGAPPGSHAINNRSHVTNKLRAETVRLPNNAAGARRETIDRVPTNGQDSLKKLDGVANNDKAKPTGGDKYVDNK